MADILSWAFLLSGSFFAIVGGIGVMRFPDLFTRLHAAGVTDTGGAGLILLGLMFQGGLSLVTVKLLLILGFLWFSSPVSTYALARAALAGGEEPFWAEDLDLPPSARIPGMVRNQGSEADKVGSSEEA
ncbi:MAG: monovalent cation/H(+) antiporter subunit G [Gemmatimonadetes bacterium]|nr:monovalent cation/H(+) antiporter subunit G [Gemmatimonadota bacterium]